MNRTAEDDTMGEPTLYELSAEGRRAVSLPDCDVEEATLPEHLVRTDNGLPELSEQQIVPVSQLE